MNIKERRIRKIKCIQIIVKATSFTLRGMLRPQAIRGTVNAQIRYMIINI